MVRAAFWCLVIALIAVVVLIPPAWMVSTLLGICRHRGRRPAKVALGAALVLWLAWLGASVFAFAKAVIMETIYHVGH
jgi:hypothetical protein